MTLRVHVVGMGAWGTALAQVACFANHKVTLVGRDAQAAASINTAHRLPRYLGETVLDPNLVARTDFEGIERADLVLMVVPAQATRITLGTIGSQALAGKPVILCAKGFEKGTNKRQSEILAEMAPGTEPFVLSGPSFAHDVANGRPTAVTLAGWDERAADEIANALAGPSFRPYVSDDPVGVELCGGLKNVYALGSGAIEGAGLGLSARSAFLARAYAEVGRVLGALGGSAATLGGLAGIGDLALSCTSNASRNYAFGMALGTGQDVAGIQASGIGLAEGVFTAPVALELARKAGVETPLIEAVNLLINGAAPIESIVAKLMARPLKKEG